MLIITRMTTREKEDSYIMASIIIVTEFALFAWNRSLASGATIGSAAVASRVLLICQKRAL